MLALLWVLQVSRFKDTKRVLVGFPPQVSRFKDTWRAPPTIIRVVFPRNSAEFNKKV